MMRQAVQRITDNLSAIRQSIADAAARSRRSVDDIQLVAVTKYVSADLARCVVEAGCDDLGESRPQQLRQKAEQLADLPVRWHLIGHLQRNKISLSLPHVTLVHSLDSLRLGTSIQHWAMQRQVTLPALVEVNISGDANKHGFAPGDVEAAIEAASAWPHIQLRGLMAMASRTGGSDAARRNFVALRQLRDRLVDRFPDGPSFPELSMGMSGDYVVAIEEGATLVRIGSALFEGIDR